MAGTRDRHGRLPHLAQQVVAAHRPHTGLRAYVRMALARDYSGRQALELYRRAGGRVRTQTFYELWEEAGHSHR